MMVKPHTVQSLDTRRELFRFMDAIEQFRQKRPGMLAHQIIAFLHVALHEGKSHKEYARELGVTPSSASYTFGDLGNKPRGSGAGLGLVVTSPNPADGRETLVHLTPRGQQFALGLGRILRGERLEDQNGAL